MSYDKVLKVRVKWTRELFHFVSTVISFSFHGHSKTALFGVDLLLLNAQPPVDLYFPSVKDPRSIYIIHFHLDHLQLHRFYLFLHLIFFLF